MNYRKITTCALLTVTLAAPVHANWWRLGDDALDAVKGVRGAKTAAEVQRLKRAELAYAQQRRTAAIAEETRIKHLASQRAEHVARQARQKELAAQQPSLKSTFGEVRNPQIIYRRFDERTGEYYVGRAEHTQRYLARQKEHNRALQHQHHYSVIATARNRKSARVAEETAIRTHKNSPTVGSRLQNSRYEMNNKDFARAGGAVDKPNTVTRIKTPTSGYRSSQISSSFNTNSGVKASTSSSSTRTSTVSSSTGNSAGAAGRAATRSQSSSGNQGR